MVPPRAYVFVDGIHQIGRSMADLFNEELGRLIRTARTGKLTQAALGDRIGLSRTAITNIECGRQRLLVDQLVEIADALGVSAAELLPASRSHDARQSESSPAITEMPTVERWIKSVKQSSR
jgi:transcriptional regulator with XRE-family HTH domain